MHRREIPLYVSLAILLLGSIAPLQYEGSYSRLYAIHDLIASLTHITAIPSDVPGKLLTLFPYAMLAVFSFVFLSKPNTNSLIFRHACGLGLSVSLLFIGDFMDYYNQPNIGGQVWWLDAIICLFFYAIGYFLALIGQLLWKTISTIWNLIPK